MTDAVKKYKHLLNVELPQRYTFPVRNNHCFNRIILDWLFKDCWYKHLDKTKTALNQLTEKQIMFAIKRMNEWLNDQSLLIADNKASLAYRNRLYS